jgi:hypothetical protein
MTGFAKGKHAKAISDRSGMEFPYREMVKEWNSGGSVISGTTEDFYTFTVDTNTATTGGVSGGGVFCTSGPATLES